MRFDNAHYRTPAWRATRKRILARDPRCTVAGCGMPSYGVEHLKPRAQGGTDADTNLAGRCQSCLNRKAAQYDGGFGHKTKSGDVRAKGCDINGYPLDPTWGQRK